MGPWRWKSSLPLQNQVIFYFSKLVINVLFAFNKSFLSVAIVIFFVFAFISLIGLIVNLLFSFAFLLRNRGARALLQSLHALLYSLVYNVIFFGRGRSSFLATYCDYCFRHLSLKMLLRMGPITIFSSFLNTWTISLESVLHKLWREPVLITTSKLGTTNQINGIFCSIRCILQTSEVLVQLWNKMLTFLSFLFMFLLSTA